jgi:hypothetical protein
LILLFLASVEDLWLLDFFTFFVELVLLE